ncbi:MAG: Mur ligase family protein [Candidatus Saccharimonadales bacterium]
MRGLLSLYSPRYPAVLVYMLQSTEYQVAPYLKWYWQTQDFSQVMYRRTLHRTKAARLLLLAARLGIATQVLAGLLLVWLWFFAGVGGGLAFGLALIIGYPVLWAHLIVLPLVLGRIFIAGPSQRRQINASRKIFADFSGITIAIAGSYGKTSMKELLLTVLGEGLKVKATPANKNVSISHAQFAQKLDSNEDVIIVEYGEAKPGDVARFADITRPDCAVITGVAAAHLDKYKTVQAAGRDIFSLAHAVPADSVFVNSESPEAKQFIKPEFRRYDRHGVLGWKVENVHIGLDGTRFTLKRQKDKLALHSKLLGRHQIGPLALAAALALALGLNHAQVERGIAKTAPFEHRMQPYQLHGAHVIDDSYNGNLEGIRAGTELLRELPGKRKIYVTPGLVDQGKDSSRIHREIGRLIAEARPDIVVLMQHSVTADIQKGLDLAGFKGQIIIEDDPLNFYQNLSAFVAHGDLVMLQNDWPDNYT